MSSSPSRLSFLYLLTFASMILLLPLAAKPVLVTGGGILALLSLLILRTLPEPAQLSRGGAMAFAMIVAMAGISALWSHDPGAVFGGAGRLAIVLAGGFLIVGAVSQMPLPSHRHLLVLPILAGIATLTLIGFHLSGFWLQHWWLDGTSGAATATMVNKATASLVLMLPPLAGILLFATARGKLWAGGLTLLTIFGLMISESQSSLLAIVIMLIVLALPIQSRKMWRLLRITLIAGLLAAPWLAGIIFDHLAEPVKNITWLASASIPQRFEVWNAYAKEIFAHPLLGQGYDAARHIERLQIGEIYQRGITFTHPHNMALQIWLEFGAIGAVIGAGLIAALLRLMEKANGPTTRRLYLASFLPAFAVGQIGWGMWQTWWLVLMFLIVALTVLAARVRAQNKIPDAERAGD